MFDVNMLRQFQMGMPFEGGYGPRKQPLPQANPFQPRPFEGFGGYKNPGQPGQLPQPFEGYGQQPFKTQGPSQPNYMAFGQPMNGMRDRFSRPY
jgi:hypothetical protein